MSLIEREQKCLKCAGAGIDRPATNGNFCEDCLRQSLLSRRLQNARGIRKMREHGDGRKVNRMAMKCACGCGAELSARAVSRGWKFLLNHKKGLGNAPKTAAKATQPNLNGYRTVIAELKLKREKIDRALVALEEVALL